MFGSHEKAIIEAQRKGKNKLIALKLIKKDKKVLLLELEFIFLQSFLRRGLLFYERKYFESVEITVFTVICRCSSVGQSS